LRRNAEAIAEFKEFKPDLAIVAAYGLILPKEILDAPKFGCINIHASLLPRWRGASPIQHAIWKGDPETGICLMKMEEGLDTGPVYTRRSCPITMGITAAELHDNLARMGAEMIVPLLDQIAGSGLPEAEAQDDAEASYAPLLNRQHGRIDWNETAEQIDRQIRALNPWPGTWTETEDGRRFKVMSAEVVSHKEGNTENSSGAEIGWLLDRRGYVVCGTGSLLRLIRVQPDNARPMDFASAVNGGFILPKTLFL